MSGAAEGRAQPSAQLRCPLRPVSDSAPISEPCECQTWARPESPRAEGSSSPRTQLKTDSGWRFQRRVSKSYLKQGAQRRDFRHCDRRRYLGGISHGHVPADTFAFMFSQTWVYLCWHWILWANGVGTAGWIIEKSVLTHKPLLLGLGMHSCQKADCPAVSLKAS